MKRKRDKAPRRDRVKVARFSVNEISQLTGLPPHEVRQALADLAGGPLRPLEPIPGDDFRQISYELVTWGQ